MLDFRLYTFLILSQTLNYTKAAERLCITQPAVSQHIKFLENEYHRPLFFHIGKELKLTNYGSILKQSVEHMAADEKHTLQLLQLSDDQSNLISFGATLTIGEFLLPPYLCAYQKHHPNTHLRMQVKNTSTLINMLKKGDILFAFVEGYFNKSEVSYRTFRKQKFVAVKHKDYQLKKEIHQIKDLLDENIILREAGSGTREILERVLHEHNLTLDDFKNTMEIGNINVIKYMLKEQCGISILYEAAVHEEIASGLFEIIHIHNFDIEREFSFITRSDGIYTEQVFQFLDEIESYD